MLNELNVQINLLLASSASEVAIAIIVFLIKFLNINTLGLYLKHFDGWVN